MDAVIPEARVTLDTGLFGENVVVLALKVASDLAEPSRLSDQSEGGGRSHARGFVVNVVPKARGVNDGQRNTHTVLLELCTR